MKGSVATPTTPATYATKSVTVPMGQQKTIAYIAPRESSQMTFTVQKADGSCVGSDCSTYLPDWNDGSGSSSNWAGNISPSLNSQIKAGQHWTMTIQNAGLGYTGTLSSPSGQKLPEGGAQFTLMTQNEINDQPHWATAVEKIGGEVIAVVGITILTAGTGDAAIAGAEVIGETAAETTSEVSVLADNGSLIAETVQTDSWYEAMAGVNFESNMADVQAALEKWGTELPMIEYVDEVPYAEKGLRPSPEDKMIAQAIKEFGF